MGDFEIRGVEQLAALARQLKAAGATDLKKELSKGIRESVKPFKDQVKENALDMLPHRGGLNQVVAAKVTPRVQRSAAQGVRIRAVGKSGMKDIRRMDGGSVRHPVYGNRSAFVDQSVTPGFWTKAVEVTSPEVQKELLAAIDAVVAKINGGA